MLGRPAKTALIYAGVAAAWITITDYLVEHLPVSPFFNTIKGWFFVLVTTLALYSAVRRSVTALNRSHEENRRIAEQFRSLVENAPDSIVIQVKGEFRYLNPAAVRMFGASRAEELIGRPVLERTHPDFHNVVRERIRLLREERIAVPVLEQRSLRIDGTAFDVEVSAAPIEYQGERGALVFFRDISERKRAEAEHSTLEEQFRHAQRMESIGRLASGVAHDFNNHLTVINGYADLLLMGIQESSGWRPPLESIRQAGHAAAGLTRQLLAFSRKEAVQPVPLDLNALLKQMHHTLRALLREDLELRTRVDEEPAMVLADPGWINQVIMNLVVNAKDALPQAGCITISTERREIDQAAAAQNLEAKPGSYVVMTVADNGCGMDEETRRRIFEPFFTTKEAGRGTGLGLYTVYGIARNCGGWVTVESRPGAGSAFHVYLPHTDEAERTADEPAVVPAHQARETILVVEDQDAVRQLAVSILQQQGYRLLCAANGQQALDAAAILDEPIALLVTDVIMPGMSGRELAERFQDGRPEAKVLFISGYDEGMLKAGEPYLAKPFSPRDLVRRVGEILGHEARQPS